MQGCAHSSRTSQSAKSPLPTRSRLRLFRSCHPIPTHRVEAMERLTEEDAEADRPFITALTISKARGGLPAPGSSAAPDVSAGSYDPPLLSKSLPDLGAASPARPRAAENAAGTCSRRIRQHIRRAVFVLLG